MANCMHTSPSAVSTRRDGAGRPPAATKAHSTYTATVMRLGPGCISAHRPHKRACGLMVIDTLPPVRKRALDTDQVILYQASRIEQLNYPRNHQALYDWRDAICLCIKFSTSKRYRQVWGHSIFSSKAYFKSTDIPRDACFSPHGMQKMQTTHALERFSLVRRN